MKSKKLLIIILCSLFIIHSIAQPPHGIHWSVDGNSYYDNDDSGIVQYQMPSFKKITIATTQQLTPKDSSQPLKVRNFFFLKRW